MRPTVQTPAARRQPESPYSPLRHFHHLHWHPRHKIPDRYRLLVDVVVGNGGHVLLQRPIDDDEPTLCTCWRRAYGYRIDMPYNSIDAYLRVALADPRSGLVAHTRDEPCP